MNERECLKRLFDQARDTVALLSSHRKSEREQMVCAAFLRCLGVEFSPNEITMPKSDPPDVIFRDARFEVMIVLDKERKMHADWKAEVKKLSAAKHLDDLAEPYHPPIPMAFAEVVDRVTAELAKKASHYDRKTCSALDVLVYVDLRDRHPYLLSEIKVPEEVRLQGWRSASFIFSPYSHVLFTVPEAPDLLHRWEGQTRQECKNPDKIWI